MINNKHAFSNNITYFSFENHSSKEMALIYFILCTLL